MCRKSGKLKSPDVCIEEYYKCFYIEIVAVPGCGAIHTGSPSEHVQRPAGGTGHHWQDKHPLEGEYLGGLIY